jgi:hypothetical protein
MLKLGYELTVIVIEAELVQPFALAPVTVYVVVEEGRKETPFVTPPVQLYELAPVPNNVICDPAQTVEEGDAIAPTVGKAFTVTVMLAESLQPFTSVPVTE